MALNAFRLSGDLLRVIAVCMILHRLFIKKNAQGISLKTQDMLLMVSLTRYSDLFTTFYSIYNSALKVFYISSSIIICYTMRRTEPMRSTHRAEQDSFAHWKLGIIPCAVLAFIQHVSRAGIEDFDLMELLWCFSMILEAVALLPQAIMYRRFRQVESLTGFTFLLMMGLYKDLYMLNWYIRAKTELHFMHHYFVYICAGAQFLIALGSICPPTLVSESQTSQPLLPQMKQFCRETYIAWVVFVILTMMMFAVDALSLDVMQDGILGAITSMLVMVPCLYCTYFHATTSRAAQSTEAGADDENPATADLSTPLLLEVNSRQEDNDERDDTTTPHAEYAETDAQDP